MKAEGTFSHPGVTGKNQDAQLGQLGTSHIDSKGLMSQLCVDYRGRNPNLDLKNQKLSYETQGWGLTTPVNLCICKTAGHKLYVKHLAFSNVLNKLAQHRDLCFLKHEPLALFGVQNQPLQTRLSPRQKHRAPLSLGPRSIIHSTKGTSSTQLYTETWQQKTTCPAQPSCSQPG